MWARSRAGKHPRIALQRCDLDILMFADDTSLLSKSATGIQKQIESLEIFCSKEVNSEKTKTCVFGTSKTHLFKFGSTYQESVSEYKYLGVWITRSGKFVKAKNNINLQAKQVTRVLQIVSC